MPSSRPRPAAAPASYHHGALREALLEAAGALLQERGVEAFTLRECARRAGVSHAAPAHHFGDARGLLTALAALGFDRMADLMHRYRDTAPADPLSRLVAVGRAYIDFALRHAAHFKLMFGSDRLDPADSALQQAGQRSADALREAMAAVVAERQLPEAQTPQRLLLAWSAVHGYATLVIEGQCLAAFGLGPAHPRQAGEAGAAMLQLLAPALAGKLNDPPAAVPPGRATRRG
jgi:AcrR family transcriptional regulator